MPPELHHREKVRKVKQVHRRVFSEAWKNAWLEVHDELEQVDEDPPDARVVPEA